MVKKQQPVLGEPKVKDIMRHLRIELKIQHPEDDMQMSRENYKVPSSSAVDNNDHLKILGFGGGIDTYMCTRDKSVIFSDKCLYDMGRSWFKQGLTKNDECSSMNMDMSKMETEIDDDAKKYLQELVERSKAAKALSRKKAQKKVVAKMQNLSDKIKGINLNDGI